MAYEVNGKTIETTEAGYLVDLNDWNEEVAQVIANEEGIGELSKKHWDVLNYLRDEYINNNGNQPMERIIQKAMAEKWGDKNSPARTTTCSLAHRAKAESCWPAGPLTQRRLLISTRGAFPLLRNLFILLLGFG